MATNAELYAMLQSLTPQSFAETINYFTPDDAGQSFIDADRQKLFVTYPANTAAGQTVRALYRAIDAGEDPQAVLDDFTVKFDAGEFDRLTDESGSSLGVLTPDDASKIVDAVAGTAVKRTQLAKSRQMPLDVLKDLGLTELAPLLPALEASIPKYPKSLSEPSGLSSTYQSMLSRLGAQRDVAEQAVAEAEKPKLAKNVKIDFGAGPEVTLPAGVVKGSAMVGGAAGNVLGGGSLKGKAISALGPLGMLWNAATGAGKAAKEVDQKLSSVNKNQLAYAKFVQRELDKKIKKAQQAATEEKQFTNKVQEETLRRIAEYESKRPAGSTPFDVTKALLMKASRSK